MTLRNPSSTPAALHRAGLASLFVALALSACGGGGGSDATNAQPAPPPPVVTNPQPEPSPPPVVTNPQPDPTPPPVLSKGGVSLLAGSLGGAGNLDGVGAAARFNNPLGLGIGPNGDLYVADRDNGRIRKVTPAGVVSTVAGSGAVGCVNGPALQASFTDPRDVAVGPDASVFVIDGVRVRRIDTAGNVATVAGTTTSECYPGTNNSNVAPTSPNAIAVDAAGTAYINDRTRIYTLTPDGTLTHLVGTKDPALQRVSSTVSDFRNATGIALDAARNIYVAEDYLYADGTKTVRGIDRLDPTGRIAPVVPASTALGEVNDIARDAAGNVYMVDSVRNVVRKATPAGSVSIIAGIETERYMADTSIDGPLGAGRLAAPQGIAVATDGTVYVSDQYAHSIRRIDPVTGDLSTFAGLAPTTFYGEYHAVDRAGNVFVAVLKLDTRDYAIQRIAPDGRATTLVPGGLNAPRGMAIDSAGNLFVVDVPRDDINNCVGCRFSRTTAFVRKITPQGEMSIFAGNPANASRAPDADGAGTAANLSNARALTIDPVGNLYVSQYLGAPLRKITPQGVVSTLPVALPGTEQYPSGLAADAAGNIYLSSCPVLLSQSGFTINPADAPPGAAVLKVDPSGNVTQLAGSTTEVGYVDGPGAQARFAANRGSTRGQGNNACLTGLTLDAAGNLYVADKANDAVRKITPDGTVSTVVGQKGVRGIALGPLPTSLSQPTDVGFDAAGNLYIVSTYGLLKVQFDR